MYKYINIQIDDVSYVLGIIIWEVEMDVTLYLQHGHEHGLFFYIHRIPHQFFRLSEIDRFPS